MSSRKGGGHQVDEGGGVERTDYVLAVRTGDVFGAGTQANVHATILGRRDAGEPQLRSTPVYSLVGKFVRNQTDVFRIRKAPSVGRVEQLLIGHDGCAAGLANNWYLDSVELMDERRTAGERLLYHFECRHWLAEHKEDRLTQRRLVCAEPRRLPPPPPAELDSNASSSFTNSCSSSSTSDSTSSEEENEQPPPAQYAYAMVPLLLPPPADGKTNKKKAKKSKENTPPLYAYPPFGFYQPAPN